MLRFFIVALMAVTLGWSALAVGGNHGQGLPPGLQKKMEQGKPLPPGWQKKLGLRKGDYLYDELYRYGTVRNIDGGWQEIKVEDRIYRVIKDTREILDILDQ